MSIQALGYLGVGSDKFDDWTAFAVNWLGMQAVDRGAGPATHPCLPATLVE